MEKGGSQFAMNSTGGRSQLGAMGILAVGGLAIFQRSCAARRSSAGFNLAKPPRTNVGKPSECQTESPERNTSRVSSTTCYGNVFRNESDRKSVEYRGGCAGRPPG